MLLLLLYGVWHVALLPDMCTHTYMGEKMSRRKAVSATPVSVLLPAPVLLSKYHIDDIFFTKDKGYVLWESCAIDCHTVTTVTANWYFNHPVVRITSGDGDALIKLEWNGEGWDKV